MAVALYRISDRQGSAEAVIRGLQDASNLLFPVTKHCRQHRTQAKSAASYDHVLDSAENAAPTETQKNRHLLRWQIGVLQ